MKDTLRNIATLYHNGGVKFETCVDAIKNDRSFVPKLVERQVELADYYADTVSTSLASVKKKRLMNHIGNCILEKSALTEVYMHDNKKSTLAEIKRIDKNILECEEELEKCNAELGEEDAIPLKIKSISHVLNNRDAAAKILLYAALVIQYADEEAAKLYNQSVFEVDDFYALDELFRNFGIPDHRDIDRVALGVRLAAMDRKYNPPRVISVPIQSYKVESDSAYRCLLNMAPWYGSVDYSGKDLISIIADNGSIIGMKL